MNYITRSLHLTLPFSLQRFLRDWGIFRAISDLNVTILAVGLLLSKPSMLLDFFRLGNRTRTINYQSSEALQVIDVTDTDLHDHASKKTIVFVHGGAWGSGKAWMYRNLAYNFAKTCGCQVLTLLSYKVFPDSSIEEQTRSVISSINAFKRRKESTAKTLY